MSVVAVLFLLALVIGPAISLIRAWQVPVLSGWLPVAQSSAPPGSDRVVGWVSALVSLLLSVCGFMLLYRTIPRTRVTWGDVWLGGQNSRSCMAAGARQTALGEPSPGRLDGRQAVPESGRRIPLAAIVAVSVAYSLALRRLQSTVLMGG